MNSLYDEAGIRDLDEFYAERFFTGGVFDARYFNPINRFHIKYARTMWVYDNVRAGAEVLDLGCGEGLLAVLTRKGVRLTGLDISPRLAEVAQCNGYADVRIAPFTSLPFPDESFDYVVSLDVFGHVDFAEKDTVLGEMRRVLRPGGVTLHGIETLDAERFGSYERMSEEERARFVRIDGHIGLETEEETANRFARFFHNVQWEGRYALCLSSEEFLKQADEYRRPFEADFIAYLRGLSFHERRAFDMAMGYVFGKISDLHVRLPNSGLYMLLKASDSALGAFYNEHRDRAGLLSATETNESHSAKDRLASDAGVRCLDRAPDVTFDYGWYDADFLPPVARWMDAYSCLRFKAASLSKLCFDLTTHMPGLAERPLNLKLLLNGECVSSFSIFSYGWLEVAISLPQTPPANGLAAATTWQLEIFASHTWQPSATDQNSRDDRQFSIAVCNIEIYS